MEILGVIGGSGLNELPEAGITESHTINTPFGEPSAPLRQGQLAGCRILFLARHGVPHHIAPHCINYQANIWALKQQGVTDIIAINAVGGITEFADTGAISVPSQLIDYSYGRAHTYFSGKGIEGLKGFDQELKHIDFTKPFHSSLRKNILQAASTVGVSCHDSGTYACTQGPRLETAAEITRLERDGCDVVGMTAMPEAGLAAELGMNYAMICLVVNKAAGKSDQPLTMEAMTQVMAKGMISVKAILQALCK